LAEGLEHHGVVKHDGVGIAGPVKGERADNAAGLRHGFCHHDAAPAFGHSNASPATTLPV